MNIKTIGFFSLLFVTHCANAVKQTKPNLIKKLVDEIKLVDKIELVDEIKSVNKSSYDPALTNYAYRKIIVNHMNSYNKHLPKQKN